MPAQNKRKITVPFLRRRAEKAVAALPPLLALAERTAAQVAAGGHRRRIAGTGQEFWQFREYNTGDRAQDIDWRQSARGDRLYVRQKEWQTAQTTLFWCQTDENMTYRSQKDLPAKQDAAWTLTLALALLLTRAEEQIGLAGMGHDGRGRSSQAVQELGEILINARGPRMEDALKTDILPHTGLVLSGDFLEPLPVLTERFSRLAARTENVLLVQVLDPAERTLPFTGRAVFKNPRGGERFPVASVPAVRADYQARIKDHLHGLDALCRRYNWERALHTTENSLTATLRGIVRHAPPERGLA